MTVLLLASVVPVQAKRQDHPKSSHAPVVRSAEKHDTLKSLKDAKVKNDHKKGKVHEAQPVRRLPKAKGKGKFGPKTAGTSSIANGTTAAGTSSPTASGAAPAAPVGPGMPSFATNFEGVGNLDEVLPPDTEGDIGTNYYMQWVNLHFQVYDRNGNPQLPTPDAPEPQPGNSLFAGFGGICEDTNWGDPIVQFDHLANRWMATQFAIFGSDGNHQCIAISQTDDPTGAWYRYDFLISATKINDYPKFGVWPDAYYMTANLFDQDTQAFAGAGAVAFERGQMLQGLPAKMVFFDLEDVDPRFGGMLPSDLDGLNPPPAGAPNTFAEVDDDAFGFPQDQLSLWQFHVDWNDPTSSTFGLDGQPNTIIPTAPFESEICGFSPCIPQPGTDQGLDQISDRLMYRLQYRNFGDRQTLVANHTVDVDGNDHAGIRWYILQDTGSGWGIDQQGDYAPDAASRWMGSAALDAAGNLAIGYSVSSKTIYPSIRTAGRLSLDPPGTLPQPEGELIAGTGSQTHFLGRWGDYSAMQVDPTDDCTFWYTNEYLTQTSEADWHTRVGAFKYPNCTTGPRGTIQGTVTTSPGGDPLANAMIEVGALSTVTDANGHYAILVPADTYSVSASSYGYRTHTVDNVVVGDGATETVDFQLESLPTTVVSGTVTDAGHGWPLYATVEVGGAPLPPLYTDPVTGHYEVTLFQETDYSFKVNGIAGSYLQSTRQVTATTATQTEDFALAVDTVDCAAPGYQLETAGLSETFPDPAKPAGWLNLDNSPAGGQGTWRFDDPANRGNLTGGTGNFATIDSDFLGPDFTIDTELWTPNVDLSAIADPSISFRTDFFEFDGNDQDRGPEVADVDLSIDGGSNWTTVWHKTESVRGPQLETVPIPDAANQAHVRVRFHYYNANFEWWWQVDDVIVGTRDCNPIPGGGLLVGNVSDANTGDPLDGAKVASVEASADVTTSFPTPDDPAQADGLYVLYSSLTGSHDFAASKGSYADDTDAVDVAPATTTQHDFSLAAGQLSGTPNPIEVTLGLGQTTDAQLTLNNTGGADATFKIRERDAGLDILAATGAPRKSIKGDFTTHSLKREHAKPGEGGEEHEGGIHELPLAPPWVGVADYPMTIEANRADVFDGKVYSAGGFSFDTFDFVSDAFVFDPAANAWSPIAGLSVAREAPNGAFVGDKFYVVGGWAAPNGDPSPTLEIYDPATDTWSNGADDPAPYAASGSVVLDGKLYLIGGCNAFSCGTDTVQVYDPDSDSWSFVANYPEPTSWVSCGAINGQIYCAGGVSDDQGDSANAYVYDPAGDSWSPIASFPTTDWGAGYVAANGQLLVSGGVADGNVTNTGYTYDPGTDSWAPLPNSNEPTYRSGSACGFYKIGGFADSGDMIAGVEQLPDFDECGSAADVPWLSEDPVEGSVPAGGNTPINVHFDASVEGVSQPGAYKAQLTFREDTPYSTVPIDVIMHITPAAGTGKLTGTVTGLERCDGDGSPLSGATVHIDGTDTDLDLKTATDGSYEIWMPATNGPVSIHVTKNGYVAGDATGIVIPADNTTTTQDFALRLDAPCASVTPPSVDVTLTQGFSADGNLDLGNTGGAKGYDFVIDESPFDLATSNPNLPVTRTFSKPVAIGPGSIRSAKHGDKPVSAAPAPLLPAWLGGAPLPGGAVRYAHAQCDGDPIHFYAIGGVDQNFGPTNQAARYDSAANAWTILAPIPQGSEGATGVCIAGRIHVFGGDGTDMHWVYDIATDSWSAGAPVPRGVAGATAAGWGGTIILAGGTPDFSTGGSTDEVDVYDIASDTWTGTASAMPDGTSFSGYAQAAQYLYVVGGYDKAGGFDTNVVASQRYDLSSDTWTTGPDLQTGRADFALAATTKALYAMGGDLSGGSIFEPGDTVERLATSGWSGGSWAGYASLPAARTANSAGYCSEGFDGGEVWSVAGANADINITDGTFVTLTPGERCPSVRGDVPWLSVDPTSGSVAADGSQSIAVHVNAGSLVAGTYTATLLVRTTDPAVPEVAVGVHVTVEPAKALIGVESAGTVAGVTGVTDEDIVAIAQDDTGAMYFDGSDVGIGSLAIDAFAKLDDGSLLFSFTKAGSVPGVSGTVDPADIVRFVPTSLGADTAGAFSMWFDGSDVGLTTNNENVDAIDVAGGRLYLSTTGTNSVPGISGSNTNADILAFQWTSLGATTAGTWSLYADMSDVGLTGNNEDVDALAVVDPTTVPGATMDISTTGAMSVPGLSAADDDVSTINLTATGATTAGTWSSTPYLDGSALGIDTNDITAFELP